jgi:arylsulfatase A-like enzyme
MADDQGWGETSYYNHPVLKTPNLDAMAANGLRFDRFYAGGPVCSPTRATVLTGRTHDRTGVYDHGYALRDQEKTLPEAMKKAGYATGHFGKWHLNGLRGPGVPVLKEDSHGPGGFGFDTWLSVTNFFDLDPVMSRNGTFEEFEGDSSEVIVHEALQFMKSHAKKGTPFFCVIWYGTPHSPWWALEKDKAQFKELNDVSAEHYGELVAMDRSIGALRQGLRDCGVHEDTLVWFCSDNGGLPGFTPSTTGGLRSFKSSMYEGGLRVPGIIEWPKGICHPRVTSHPAGAVDIFPTVASIVGLPDSSMLKPQDGVDLTALFKAEVGARKKPLIFRSRGRHVVIDNDWKILSQPNRKKEVNIEVYNLKEDAQEAENLAGSGLDQVVRLTELLEKAATSIEASNQGKDYPEGEVKTPQPPRMFWRDHELYKKYFSEWKDRPEYKGQLKKL